MVLTHRITVLLLILCLAPGIAIACDPNFQAVEMFSLQVEPLIYPGLFLLCSEIFTNTAIQLPELWESVAVTGSRDNSYLGEIDRQFFVTVMSSAAKLVQNLHNKLVGRLIINSVPMLMIVSKDGLRNEGWQTLVMQVTIPVVSKLVIYEPGAAIRFIDELDASLSFSLTMAWPPVLVKHIRIWNRHGMIYSWPEEDTTL